MSVQSAIRGLMMKVAPPTQNVSGFVFGGGWRYMVAINATVLPKVRAEVEAQYEQRLAAAGPMKRLLLRREMKSEIIRRLAEKVPQPSDSALF